ncbi:MAG: hypothetical protein PHV82_06870 [Victivallaceae bacterium]|nr:hypothetical protein [Victivallaceae bacterium]
MGFTLEKVVPWGRSFAEYVAMFALTESDLRKSILGCGDGPAAFNAELTKRGGRVVSVDPVYRFSADEIRSRIAATYDKVIEQTVINRNEFVWKNIKSVEELARVRMAAMESFLEDFPKGVSRYIAAELPSLPFKDREFELALCSHFLFLYSEQFSAEFHVRAVEELCRVADEVRIFPLLELGARKSRHFDRVVAELRQAGYRCVIEEVNYEFQKGGKQMLKVIL